MFYDRNVISGLEDFTCGPMDQNLPEFECQRWTFGKCLSDRKCRRRTELHLTATFPRYSANSPESSRLIQTWTNISWRFDTVTRWISEEQGEGRADRRLGRHCSLLGSMLQELKYKFRFRFRQFWPIITRCPRCLLQTTCADWSKLRANLNRESEIAL